MRQGTSFEKRTTRSQASYIPLHNQQPVSLVRAPASVSRPGQTVLPRPLQNDEHHQGSSSQQLRRYHSDLQPSISQQFQQLNISNKEITSQEKPVLSSTSNVAVTSASCSMTGAPIISVAVAPISTVPALDEISQPVHRSKSFTVGTPLYMQQVYQGFTFFHS